MSMITTYDYIESNKKKTILLILLFPVSLAILLFITIYFYALFDACTQTSKMDISILYNSLQIYWKYLIACLIFSTLWTIIAFYHGNNFIIDIIHAKKVSEKEYKETKRIIENVSITAGIKPPKLYIVESETNLNAFTTGINQENAIIVLTYGLIQNLDNSELEAVIAHEIAHIVHQDTKLMFTIALVIGAFTFIGRSLLGVKGKKTTKSKGSKGGGLLLLVGFVLYIYGIFIAPIIRFTISRTREYKADAKAALLTRNPQALISALKKISKDPIIDIFNNNELMAPMCIVNPLRINISLFDKLSNLSATHPPISERIKALEVMDGKNIDFFISNDLF